MASAFCFTVSCLQARWLGYMAIGVAVVVGVPASFAQNPPVLGQGKSAANGIEAEERQTHDETSDGQRSEVREPMGVFVAVPTGRVWVGPEFVDGEPSYVRRTKVREGVTIVEVSTTPFVDEPPGFEGSTAKPAELPASW